jgi:cysteinyl-tRNA synthetase
VFRLHDAQTGQAAEITAARGGLLRMFAGGPPPSRRVHAGELRALLLADLIRRNAEQRHHLSVIACLIVADDAGGAEKGAGEGFLADASTLNLRPAERSVSRSDPVLDGVSQAQPGLAGMIADGRILVDSRSAGRDRRPAPSAPPVTWVRAGPVRFDGQPVRDSAAALTVPGIAQHGLDPLALRLAFCSCGYRERADLSWDVLAGADERLRAWRERVAEWAESPSKPVDAGVTARVAAAVDDDLDMPAALAALAGLQDDPGVPPGSKFETFMLADQVLGLDLPRDIGRAPVRRNNSPS